MNTKERKLNLLLDMIAFAVVDGNLHERELQFLTIVAQELGVTKEELKQLFHAEIKPEVIKSEFERIQQFYRLALLMHCDNVVDDKEVIKLHEMGIGMGLNPHAIKRVLKAMEASPNQMIAPEFLLQVFQEQMN